MQFILLNICKTYYKPRKVQKKLCPLAYMIGITIILNFNYFSLFTHKVSVKEECVCWGTYKQGAGKQSKLR